MMTLRKINARKEKMEAMGWPCSGLCTSAIWLQWGEVLRLLYRDHSTSAIADLLGFTPTTISRDLWAFGVETRPIGGANNKPRIRAEFQGKERTIKDIAERQGKPYHTVYNQHREGRAKWLYGF